MKLTHRFTLIAALVFVAACVTEEADAPRVADDERSVASSLEFTSGSTCTSYSNTIWVAASGFVGPGGSPSGEIIGEVAAVTHETGVEEFAVEVSGGWTIAEIRIWIGLPEDFPLDATSTVPDFDAFPHVFTFDDPTETFVGTFDIPETVGCGMSFKSALLFDIVSPAGEHVVEPRYMYDMFSCCTDEPEETGCTYTKGYWKNHHAAGAGSGSRCGRSRGHHGRRGRGDRTERDEPWPIAESTELCGVSWLRILNWPARGSAWTILAHQWIAAQLNEANGASTPDEVADALDRGYDLLSSCHEPRRCYRHEWIDLASTLDDYNNGRIGPGHCE